MTDLTWDFVSIEMDGPTGGECVEFQCIEHPRLTRMMQRPNRDTEFVETWHIEGMVNYYTSSDAALEAMRANRCS